jgi:hypothetical protein
MPLRGFAKRLIAGLVIAGLMFQAALVAAQLSILIASKADAALPAGVICTEHGLATVPPDETDRPSACGFCPLCLTSGAGQIATLPAAGFSLIQARAQDIVFHFDACHGVDQHCAQPRSRGPPALT